MTFLTANSGSPTMGVVGTILPLVLMFVIFYFFIIKPQKKQERQHASLISSVEAGDSILTTSGFYGVVIDVMPEIVIVEFGNNKNCRIPMKKEAIVDIEKPNKE